MLNFFEKFFKTKKYIRKLKKFKKINDFKLNDTVCLLILISFL